MFFEVLGTLLKGLAIANMAWFGLVFIYLAIKNWRGEL